MVDYSNPTETQVIVRFGNIEISDGIASCKSNHPVNAPNTAETLISNETLLDVDPDYQAETQILYRVDGETKSKLRDPTFCSSAEMSALDRTLS
jgi:hypothetical protein